ncbi:TPA: transcriptional regulator [Bacillus pacificus]|nr:transcriptional regulator [Bacillus pacificus]
MIKSMKIERVSMDQLVPAEYNPRKILRKGDPGYEKLKKSLLEFGEVLPIVWNKQTGHIVGGHQRYFIYVDEGREGAHVSVVDLPIEKEKALNITLNNSKVGGEWDNEKLADLVKEMESVDIELTGFDTEDIDALLESLEEFVEDAAPPVIEGDQSNEDAAAESDQSNEESVTVLPPGEEPEPYEEDPEAVVQITIGHLRFPVEKHLYNPWFKELTDTKGGNMDEMIEEIMIRLGM